MDNVSSIIDGSIAVLGAIAGAIALVSALVTSEPLTTFHTDDETEGDAGTVRYPPNRAA